MNDQMMQVEQEQEKPGLRICIDCYADGTFEVSGAPVPEDGEESSGMEQQATSFGNALKIALALYKEQSPGANTAQQQFEAGFGGKNEAKYG